MHLPAEALRHRHTDVSYTHYADCIIVPVVWLTTDKRSFSAYNHFISLGLPGMAWIQRPLEKGSNSNCQKKLHTKKFIHIYIYIYHV